jgi:glycosyltransferase involved in cell wall biosynthesis
LWVTKGLRYLLDAIVQVNSAYSGIQFKVYGDGPLRQELMDYAGQLGLDGNAIFAGAFTRQDLTGILTRTDIFVMPSILEGQPQALIEAMAHGCPIVATNVGGIPELIQDGINGLLCAPADPLCLADKICQLIGDPALRLSLGQSARDSYEHGPFQPDAVGRELLAVYSAAIAG